jgi:methylglutaconyl-CoA hydratase
MAEFVRLESEKGVARVTLTRSELHNAFNEVMIGELRDTFTALGGNEQVRAIVLSGEGKSFCAGADLNWMKKMIGYTFEQNVEDAHVLAAMLKTIHDCPKPVIARVHGAAFGGGVGLIAACDMAVAAESATFSLSEAKLGLLPAVISPFVLKKIGPGAAHRYFLTAERFSAADALRIGLVSETAPDVESLDARIDAIIAAILANGPAAVSQCKVLIDEITHFDWDRAFDIATKMIAEKRISPEGQEGMRAFLEKRSPNWVVSAAPTA